MKRTLKSMLLLAGATLLVACGPTTTSTKAPANMDKTFVTLLRQERTVDEVAFAYHMADIQKEYADLMALYEPFTGKQLNDGQMDRVERQAEELKRAIETFTRRAPASKVHKKSEESLFQVLTLQSKLAKEVIAIANTNGIQSLGGLDGTVEGLQRPLKVLDAKRAEERPKSDLPDSGQLMDVFFRETDLPLPADE